MIGCLAPNISVWPHALEAFRQGLRELGWVEGQSIIIEYRWAEGRFDRLPNLVDELVRLKVDLPELRSGPSRSLSPRRRLCGQDPERGETS